MSSIALCIPAYNAAWCLPRLLQSANNQQIPFDEIFVYDDCSSDNTKETAEQYGATVVRGAVNQGCSYAKNMLAEIVKSEWIHFHDADDELLSNFTQLAQEWISRQDCPDVVLFDYEYRDNDTKELLGIRKFDKQKLENSPLLYTLEEQINPFCGLYRKTSFITAGGYVVDHKILYNEDSAMHMNLAVQSLSFSSESRLSLINYAVRASMSDQNRHKCAISRYYVLDRATLTAHKQYPAKIAEQLYICIASLSVFEDWAYIKKALYLCRKLGYPYSGSGSKIFNWLTRINPLWAVWLREKMIRIFKPNLRSE